MQVAKALTSLRFSAVSSVPWLLATYVISTKISWPGCFDSLTGNFSRLIEPPYLYLSLTPLLVRQRPPYSSSTLLLVLKMTYVFMSDAQKTAICANWLTHDNIKRI